MGLRRKDIEILSCAKPQLIKYLRLAGDGFLQMLINADVLSLLDASLIIKTDAENPGTEALQLFLHMYVRKANSLEPLIEAVRDCCYSNLVLALTQPLLTGYTPPSPETTRRVIRSALVSGRVPRNPDVYVERQPLLEELRKALIDLASFEDGGWVVISGLAGIGKTVLAAAILSDPSITVATFTDVYWVKIGPQGEENLLPIMKKLFSHVGQLERTLQFDCEFDSVETARSKLQHVFLHDYARALIILDDVRSKEVVRSFDGIGCRIMATVRETDLFDVIWGKKEFIRIPDAGFNLAEAMDAFARWVKKDVAALPEEASKIYRECHGHPFEISLIGSLLREHSNRWIHYYDMFRARKLAQIQKRTSYKYTNFVAAVGLSLDNLLEESGDLFRSLGVFQRGADISLKVLKTYWEKTDVAVEDIMDVFIKRSLAESQCVRSVTPNEESYRIHILLLETIKHLNGPEKQKSLHKTIIERYLKKADGRWDRLARDGYIHQYLAYHFYRSGDEDAPWEVFVTLSVMTVKLIQCGPVQTLSDLHRYKEFIRVKGEAAFDDIQRFVREKSASLNEIYAIGGTNAFVDILRLALKEPPTSVVYQQANALNQDLRFAVSRVTQNGNLVQVQPAISLRCCSATNNQAIWLNDGDSSAFASLCADGMLKIWSSSTGREFAKFKLELAGECMTISPDSRRALVSCGADLFTYVLRYDISTSMGHDAYSVSSLPGAGEYNRTPTPLLNLWPAFLSEGSHNRNGPLGGIVEGARSVRRYRWCQISNDGRQAVSGDTEGNVLIWDLDDEQTQPAVLNGHTGPVDCCVFSTNDDLVASVGEDGIGYVWKASTRQRVCSFFFNEKNQILRCCWINAGPFANCVLGVSYADLAIWLSRDGTAKMEWKAPAKANCVDISKCGGYVAAGLDDGSIFIWKLTEESPRPFSAFLISSGAKATSVNFSSDGNLLLVARQNGLIEIWNVAQNVNETDEMEEP